MIKDFIKYFLASIISCIAIFVPMLLDNAIRNLGLRHPVTAVLIVIFAFELSVLIVQIEKLIKLWEK